MLERTTRLFSENLARNMDRRSFLRRAGEVTFAGMAALMAGHLVPALASAGSGSSGVVPAPGSPTATPGNTTGAMPPRPGTATRTGMDSAIRR